MNMSDDEPLSKSSDQYCLLGRHMENYNVETTALHRKLQSKIDALRIMRKELERFRTERDQFKLMAETLQLRYSAIKRSTDSCNKSNVANILHETRERNIRLTTEIESLKQKLTEMQGDIELLRDARLVGQKVKSGENSCKSDENLQWNQERANFICHLEHLKKKNAQLAFDFKALIDEKEELIMERDAFKCKAHRLNHELFMVLKANEAHPKFLDVDSIISENKYLHGRLKCSEEELDLAKQSLNKYKTMMDSKRKKGIIKIGSSFNDESIISQKQVKILLESGVQLPSKTETIQDLKSLCLTLLDNLNDKSLALNHQKKTNKILGSKIAELEGRIQSMVGMELSSSCSSYYPSKLLLQNYCPSLVDSNVSSTSTKTDMIANKNSDDSETASAERLDCKKTSNISDDGMSSLSSESARSVVSSEYSGIVAHNTNNKDTYSLSEFTSGAMFSYCTPTSPASTTDVLKLYNSNVSSVLNSTQQERLNDLKDLPPELAALVQQALHELDLRDFETHVVSDCAGQHQNEGDSKKREVDFSDHEEDDETTVH